jgi:ethanolamine transporter
MILPLMLGKLLGGAAGFILAVWLSVPKAEELASLESGAATQFMPAE